VRVLLVTDWPLRYAGTERYVLNLREALREAGDEVRLMTSSVGSAAEGTAEYVASSTERRRAQAFLQIANPAAALTLRRALSEFEPDAVHVTMMLAYLSPAVLAPLRSSVTTLLIPDLKPVCPKGTKLLPDGQQCRAPMGAVCRASGCLSTPRAARDLVRYGAFRLGLRNVDRVLACSRHVGAELEAVGIPAQPVALPVPTPEPGFRRRPRATPHFVYAGRLAPVKGIELLLSAFARLRDRYPDATLMICGDGVQRDEVVAQAAALGLGGSLSFRHGMPWNWTEELETAWALVAPSTYREPLGLVAIEAIVRGVPVIASADGGFAESVEEGRTGLLFPNGDEDALLERMALVCDRSAFPNQLVEPPERRRLARRHDVGDHLRQMKEIWKSAT
jgi:glycosyltransferase involved in cell wall biosynthesis